VSRWPAGAGARPRRLIGWLLGSLALLVLAGCGAGADDETRIRHHLADMIDAIEQGDIDDFMAPVADDFLSADGRIDRRALGLLVRRERLARADVGVHTMDIRVERIGDKRAVATFRALATGGSGLLPDEGRLWRVETGWRRDGNRWRLISARWEPAV